MLRVPLDELVLQVHLLRLANSAEEFTAKVLQPPSAKAVEGAVRVLQEVGALTPDESLTPLGKPVAHRRFKGDLSFLALPRTFGFLSMMGFSFWVQRVFTSLQDTT